MPRGQLSEIVGPRSSGRTTLALQLMAAATREGELVALIDTFDRLDVASLVAAGADVSRVCGYRTVLSKSESAIDPRWVPGASASGACHGGRRRWIARSIGR